MLTRNLRITAGVLAFALAGCSATASFTSPQDAVSLRVREKTYATLPSTDSIKTTTFGNYEFVATTPDGKVLQGILPLKFNGGFLALDILFFAPAMFFNLRGVYPEYELDTAAGVIRYRKKGTTGWTEYQPTPAEAERARAYFGR